MRNFGFTQNRQKYYPDNRLMLNSELVNPGLGQK